MTITDNADRLSRENRLRFKAKRHGWHLRKHRAAPKESDYCIHCGMATPRDVYDLFAMCSDDPATSQRFLRNMTLDEAELYLGY